MKQSTAILIFLLVNLMLYASDDYTDWLLSGTMRVDFILAGDAENTSLYVSKIIREPFWGGSRRNLIDTMQYGDYFFNVRDEASDQLLYSRGFSTLFREWQTTSEAEVLRKAFSNSLRFPFPIREIKLEIFRRRKDQSLDNIMVMHIDPADSQIEIYNPVNYKTVTLLQNGPPETSVDIVIIAEGYTRTEIKKFKKDAKRLTDHMFLTEPFLSHRNKFNINLVFSVSRESGADVPGEGIWKNTVVNSNFYTFGIDRYLTSTDIWGIYDIAACVPYDQVVILVNSHAYGGGGIFNFYSICSSDHDASPGVLVHEFGHAFAGLGDEYYTSDVAYEGFYDIKTEPWEPNLTTLVNFDIKWKDMVPRGVPVPTPLDERYLNDVGVFEGGGYSAKGIFRPQVECIMKNNAHCEFCKVCQRAVERMIWFYAH